MIVGRLLDWAWDHWVVAVVLPTQIPVLTPAITPDMAAAAMYGEEDGTDMATLDDDPGPEIRVHWLCCEQCPQSPEALGLKKRGSI